MIDDIAEGLSKAIFKGVSRFVFEILVEFLFYYPGEIVLFILTLGKKKAKPNRDKNDDQGHDGQPDQQI